MTSCKGSSGAVYIPVGAALARGGEGTLFELQGEPDKVAKILDPPHRTDERHRKLSAMVAVHSTPATRQCAWPTDVLYVGNKFVGYVMPRVDGCGLREIYAYGKRGTKPWRYFITVARNLASAVDNFHEVGQVVGDLNPDNILVNPTSGLVRLVDTDSYHVRDSAGHVYRCSVGKSEFVAPELQGVHFPTAQLPTFTHETDRFSLALMIFMILMNGAHPFACRPGQGVSGSLLQPIENMKKGISPYFGVTPVRGIEIPAYAPAKEVLSPQVQELFERAFATGHNDPRVRPSGGEWHEALGKLAAHLSTCRVNPEHQFHSSRGKCRWCEVDERMAGLTGKPAVSAPAAVVPLATPSPRAVATTARVAAPSSSYRSAGSSSGTSRPQASTPASTAYRSGASRSLKRWWRAVRVAFLAAAVGAVLLGAAALGSGALGPEKNGVASGDVSADASEFASTLNAIPLAVEDGWIYYSCGGLYRIRIDGTDQSLLYANDVVEATVSGGWVYLVTEADGHDRGLFRMRTDGTQPQHLAGDKVRRIRVAGDRAYFLDSVHELSRVRVDGYELVELSTFDTLPGSFGSSMSIDDYEVDEAGGIVYFLHDGSLYRMPSQPNGGAESALIMKGVGGFGKIFDMARDQDYIYVVGYGGEDKDDDLLGRIRLDSSSFEFCNLSPNEGRIYKEIELLAVCDGFAYYKYETTSGQTIGRVSLATGSPQSFARVAGEGCFARAVMEGDWIYYGGPATGGPLRKMRVDGTDGQPLVPEESGV